MRKMRTQHLTTMRLYKKFLVVSPQRTTPIRKMKIRMQVSKNFPLTKVKMHLKSHWYFSNKKTSNLKQRIWQSSGVLSIKLNCIVYLCLSNHLLQVSYVKFSNNKIVLPLSTSDWIFVNSTFTLIWPMTADRKWSNYQQSTVVSINVMIFIMKLQTEKILYTKSV